MAEFPSVGKNCEWKDCNQLDFLPIICHFCRKNMCKLHFLPDQHDCEKALDNKTDVCEKTEVRYNCEVEGCKKWELAPVICTSCNIQVCLTHRHQDSHKCSNLIIRGPIMSQTKALVNNIINNQSETKPRTERKKMSKSAQKTAAKVQLMKLKMKSKGQTSLPEPERVYFLVHPPQESGKVASGYFVSRLWSVGKVIDTLADLTGTKNENNISSARKLNIERKDGSKVSEAMETTISQLLESEVVFNGDTILLEYQSK